LIPPPDAITIKHRALIVELAAKHHLPAVCVSRCEGGIPDCVFPAVSQHRTWRGNPGHGRPPDGPASTPRGILDHRSPTRPCSAWAKFGLVRTRHTGGAATIPILTVLLRP
jgi:hypothetical protein